MNSTIIENLSEQVYTQQLDEGVYEATLYPLTVNNGLQSEGSAKVIIEGDKFIVKTNMRSVESGIKHFQNIMTRGSCPSFQDDKNSDTYIDINEAMVKTGEILIPLDSYIGEQIKGLDYGPIGNSVGEYVYKRSTSLTELMIDLRSPDPDLTDSIEKLPLGSNLNMSGRAMLVHGVRITENFPSDIPTINNRKNYEIIPIACGILKRVSLQTKL